MNSTPAPPPSSIIETCLHVTDLSRSCAFYSDLFGYPVLQSGDRFCAYHVAATQVLILFLRGSDPEGSPTPFGFIPAHGSNGSSHVGFRISADTVETWVKRLEHRGIAIESRFVWPNGGTSIYFRDPDHHLLELMTPGVWTRDL